MKIVALLIVLMALVFSLVTMIIPGSRNFGGSNPAVELGKEIAKPLAQVDEIGPELSRALERSGVKLPGVSGEREGPDHALADHTGAVFANLDLPRARFAGGVLTSAQFNDALLDDADLEGASGVNVDFSGARMAKSSLIAAVFRDSDFSGAELRESTARAGDFSGSRFIGGDISFASFSGARLAGADFTNVYGAGAVFMDADLADAVFANAELKGVRLDRAVLRDAVFPGADLTAASFDGARLEGADLSGALHLTTEQLAKACADASTKLPDGVAAPRC